MLLLGFFVFLKVKFFLAFTLKEASYPPNSSWKEKWSFVFL